MNDTVLHVTTVERPPYTVIVRDKDGNVIGYRGYIFEMLNLFLDKFNISYKLIIPSDNEFGTQTENGTWTGMIGLLDKKAKNDIEKYSDDCGCPIKMASVRISKAHSGKLFMINQKFVLIYDNSKDQADMAAAFITVTEERSNVVDFSITLSYEAFTILQRHPMEGTNPGALVAPFSFQTWIAILAATGVMGPIIHCFRRAEYTMMKSDQNYNSGQTLCMSMFYVCQTLLNQSVKLNIFTNSCRILHFSWWLFILIVSALYTANLTAFMTIPIYDVKVRQMEDIPKYHDVKWVVKRGSSLHAAIITANNSTDKNMLLISLQKDVEREMGLFVREDNEAVQLVLKKNYIYIREKTILQKIIQNDLSNNRYCRFMLGADGQMRSREGFGFSKGSPYKTLFDSFATSLQVHGILIGLKNKHETKDAICPLTIRGDSTAASLSLGDFVVTYIILSAGILISIITFYVEKSWPWCHSKPGCYD